MAGLRPGTWVAAEGPYGWLTAARRSGSRVVLLGCGIGATPLRALAEELPYAYGDAVLIHRVRRDADLVFAAEFDELAGRRGLVVHRLVGARRPDRPSWLPAGFDAVDDVEGLRRLTADLDASTSSCADPTNGPPRCAKPRWRRASAVARPRRKVRLVSAPRRSASRNAAIAAATAAAMGWLLLYPTSTAGRPATVSASAEVAITRGVGGELRVQGTAVDSGYGPVQVLLFFGQDILAVEVPTYPRDSLASKAINDGAIPQLIDASFLGQTAEIDTVSGATQTSEAYRLAAGRPGRRARRPGRPPRRDGRPRGTHRLKRAPVRALCVRRFAEPETPGYVIVVA